MRIWNYDTIVTFKDNKVTTLTSPDRTIWGNLHILAHNKNQR